MPLIVALVGTLRLESPTRAPALDGLPVGLTATVAGWQAAVSALHARRTIIHALRGWPTPMGLAINAAGGGDDVGESGTQIGIMIAPLVHFIDRR